MENGIAVLVATQYTLFLGFLFVFVLFPIWFLAKMVMND